MKTVSMIRLLSGLLLSVVLAACGGGGGGGNSAAPVTAATPAPNPAPTTTPPPTTTTAPTPTPAPAPAPLAYPIPSGLWTTPVGSVPTNGNYVYLQSDQGDYIGNGKTYLYTSANARIKTSSSGLTLNVNVQGNESWTGNFLLPSGASTLQAGYFAGLTRAPFADKAVGGVDWYGEGRGCNTITGWVVIDNITLTSGVVTALDLRFEQHCEGGATALHGQIHWTQANQNSAAPSQPAAIPSTLWQPASQSGVSGSYLYLESRQGDYVGGGRTYLYTQSNAILKTSLTGSHLMVNVAGDENWSGDFIGMDGMNQLTVGYYANLMRYPFNNPVLGGLSVTGQGGCNTLSGWFVVDQVSYNGNALASIDLRFEQYCDGASAPLHGKLHWVANDTTTPPGPVNPPPAGLWAPNASFVAPSGNYVYLVSQTGEYVGGGQTQLFTTDNATLVAKTNLTAAFEIMAGGYDGEFYGMNTLSQLQPGFYGGLERYPFNNKVKGGLSVSGNSRGCNMLSGWFTVDKVTYTMAELTAIDLRFEQYCDGSSSALHGQIHWVKP